MNYRILFLIFLCSCGRQQPEEEEVIRPVVTQVALLKARERIQILSGFSRAEKYIDLSFRVSGQIAYFPLKLGDQYAKGEILAKLDEHDFKLELQETQSALDKAEAEARNAAAQYKRIKLLYESESASRNELDSARAEHEATRAAVRRAETSVKIAETNLSYTTIKATSDNCIVSETIAEINENVTAGQRLAVLSCGKVLEVEAAVPEGVINDVYVGLGVKVEFNAIEDLSFLGTITEVGNLASEGTTFPVRMQLEGDHPSLRPGMAVKVTMITLRSKEDPALTVPLAAVGEDREGRFVYTFDPEDDNLGIAKRHNVKLGMSSTSGIEIVEGIFPGDRVITAGIRYLRDGQLVKLSDYKHRERQ